MTLKLYRQLPPVFAESFYVDWNTEGFLICCSWFEMMVSSGGCLTHVPRSDMGTGPVTHNRRIPEMSVMLSREAAGGRKEACS